MLESKAELSLSRSAAVTRKVLPQRGAQHRSRQGEWRPSDIVRATPGRACRFDAPICADLLGALRACTCCASTRYAFCTGPRRVPAHDACAGTHLFGGSIPCRVERQEVHALRGRRAIATRGEISRRTPYVTMNETPQTSHMFEQV